MAEEKVTKVVPRIFWLTEQLAALLLTQLKRVKNVCIYFRKTSKEHPSNPDYSLQVLAVITAIAAHFWSGWANNSELTPWNRSLASVVFPLPSHPVREQKTVASLNIKSLQRLIYLQVSGPSVELEGDEGEFNCIISISARGGVWKITSH